MRKLHEVKKGETGKITAIDGDNRFQNRITSIGLTIGTLIEVLQNQKNHPLLVYSRDTMIALNKKECEKITLTVETI